MGLSASQARFLQLTARRSNVEYQAQQINQERLMLSEKLSQASNKYNDLTNNRTLTFNYNDGTVETVKNQPLKIFIDHGVLLTADRQTNGCFPPWGSVHRLGIF